MSDEVVASEEADWDAEYAAYEAELDRKSAVILDQYPIEKASQICEAFAEEHGLLWFPDTYVGFGRPAVAFGDQKGTFIHYDPIDFEAEYESPDFYIVKSGDAAAPEGVQAYHNCDLLAVLKTECEGDFIKTLVGLVGATTGNMEAVENSDNMERNEVPVASTNRAISQMACWIETLRERGAISIVQYDTGAEGLQAVLDGGVIFHAIVVTPRTE